MTDDRSRAGRLIVSKALLKNSIFIKFFGFSIGTSFIFHRSTQPVIGNVQDDGI